MTFKTLYQDIEYMTHLSGEESRRIIKDYINDAVRRFLALADWKRVVVEAEIEIDGSEFYPFSELPYNFFSEVGLYVGNREWLKTEYRRYITEGQKGRLYAIENDGIYIAGNNGAAKFLYVSDGEMFKRIPVADFSDVNTIVIDGDWEQELKLRGSLTIEGSESNDGEYTVSNISLVMGTDQTEITTNQALVVEGGLGEVVFNKEKTLEFDSDTNLVIKNYPHIIKQMVLADIYKYFHDIESHQYEVMVLGQMIDIEKRGENRVNKKGKKSVVAR